MILMIPTSIKFELVRYVRIQVVFWGGDLGVILDKFRVTEEEFWQGKK